MSHKKLVLLTLVFFLAPTMSWAVDYKKWLPYIPQQLDKFKAIEKAEGLDQSTASRKYVYKDNEINLTISYDSEATSVNTAKSMMPAENMDNEYGVYKRFEVQGFKGIYLNDKGSNSVTIMVIITDKTLLSLNTAGGKKMNYYVQLLNIFDLKKMATSQ